ncbi:MAG: hypothetical protein ACR2IT_06935 [Pirellulales bacterium]
MSPHGCFVVSLSLIATLLTGCGGRSTPPVPVSGTVTLHGEAIPTDAKAFISFTPTTPGAKSVSAAVTGGNYASPATPRGSVTVFFEITKPLGPPRKSDRTGQMYQETQSLVPARYAAGVPLTIEGPMTQDFDLVD